MTFIEVLWQRIVLDSLMNIYQIIQLILDKILSPEPPSPKSKLREPRIAVIGAGLTGVSAAAHCIGHGFDTTLFEAGNEDSIGGIWTKVNKTSGLQIHSLMYRFHPSVKWRNPYPKRKEIVDEIHKIWEHYGMHERTKFNCKVQNIYRNENGKWEINNPENGQFDGVIAAVGTCGEPKMPHVPGQETFKGEIFHSSQLDGKDAKGKKVIVIGGGASAVEALEFVAAEEPEHTSVLSRSEKWIIPRNPIIDIVLSLNVFGGETSLSWLPESFLRLFFYRDLADIAPPSKSKGLFTETPIVNDNVLEHIRSGNVDWIRGDILGFEENGVRVNRRSQGVGKGGPGREVFVEGDLIIMATGFSRPSLSFLPDDCFEENYEPPNWYMQTFPPKHPDLCGINCTFVNAIGTVGNYHIGIYTRFLLMYLVDPLARPRESLIKRWIAMVRWVKARAPGGAFDFFTYGELIWWFVFTLAIDPFRWKWVLFVIFGIGKSLPLAVVEAEDGLRKGIKRW